jgi:hypothetical protein
MSCLHPPLLHLCSNLLCTHGQGLTMFFQHDHLWIVQQCPHIGVVCETVSSFAFVSLSCHCHPGLLFLVDRFPCNKVPFAKQSWDGVPVYCNTSHCIGGIPFPNLSHGDITFCFPQIIMDQVFPVVTFDTIDAAMIPRPHVTCIWCKYKTWTWFRWRPSWLCAAHLSDSNSVPAFGCHYSFQTQHPLVKCFCSSLCVLENFTFTWTVIYIFHATTK